MDRHSSELLRQVVEVFVSGDPGDRSPVNGAVAQGTRLAYGVGAVAEGTMNAAFSTFVLFYYSQLLGMSPSLAGTALFIAMLFDAVSDPLMGAVSDRTRTRLGRRHPYMYTAVLPIGVGFALLFDPPAALGEVGLFFWLTGFSILVRGSMTLYQIPAASMLPEVAVDYDERTSLASYRVLFAVLGSVVTLIIAFAVFFPATAEFPQGQRNRDGYAGYGLMCALLAMATIATCAVGTHKLIPRMHRPPEERFKLAMLGADLRDALRNRPYLMLLLAALCASTANGFNEAIGIYINTYFWKFTSQEIVYLLVPLMPAVLCGAAMTRPLTQRFDKRQVAVGTMAVAAVIGPLTIGLRLLGVMPANGEPLLVLLIAIHVFVVVTLLMTATIAIVSMIADVVDASEVDTGKRQEGIFSSAITFSAKAASGLGAWIASLLLELIDFPRGASVEAGPEKVIQLGVAAAPCLVALFLLTLFFLLRFGLTRETHHETLRALAERRRA